MLPLFAPNTWIGRGGGFAGGRVTNDRRGGIGHDGRTFMRMCIQTVLLLLIVARKVMWICIELLSFSHDVLIIRQQSWGRGLIAIFLITLIGSSFFATTGGLFFIKVLLFLFAVRSSGRRNESSQG